MDEKQQGQRGSRQEIQREGGNQQWHRKNRKINKTRKGSLKRPNPGALENTLFPKSASENIESQSLVDQIASHWQQLNQIVPQDADELNNLGLSSETLLYRAAKQFRPLQLAVFKRKLRELGGEVEECSVHYKRACEFGENVSDDLLESELDPASRDKALENLQLLVQIAQLSGTVLDTIGAGLEPRQKIFQTRRIASLKKNTIALRAFLDRSAEVSFEHLHSEGHHSEDTQQSIELANCLKSLSRPIIGDHESEDYDPEELSRIYADRGRHAESSHIDDLTDIVFSSETEIAEANYQLNDIHSTDDEETLEELGPKVCSIPPDEIEQYNSLAAKLAREGFLFQQIGSSNVSAWDAPIEDITDQDTSIDETIVDAIPADESSWEDDSDQDITVGKTSTGEIDTKNTPGQEKLNQKKRPVRYTLCLNPETLKPELQNKGITAGDISDQDQKALDLIPEELSREMAIAAEISLPLPPLPADWSGNNGKDFKAVGNVSASTLRSVEPVGPHYLAHARRARHKRTFSEDDRIQAQESVKTVEDGEDGEISEVEDPAMLLRDAKDWKGQDHYAVLGLSSYRWRATEEQIKRAHRKKVLRHHPDKKAAAGSTEDDSFFKCIQKATEILLDPVKRRQFDSVDEVADVEPPTKKQTQKGNFYKLWGPVFKAEGRFSKIQPVPKLGDEASSREDVDKFYNFWYNFDSWRSFEYQDEDVPDDNENRDQKRHMERKNNNARKKKKTEDSARLRRLLDDCSTLDERIKKFRQEANASKNKKRLEKEAAEKKAAEEAKVKKEAEEKAAKEAEEAAKAERDLGKKAKEAAKNAVKKNKRILKGSVKDANYFVTGNPPPAIIDAVLNDVEFIQGKVDADEIAALAGKLTGLKVSDEIKAVWKTEVIRLIDTGKLKDGDIKTIV